MSASLLKLLTAPIETLADRVAGARSS